MASKSQLEEQLYPQNANFEPSIGFLILFRQRGKIDRLEVPLLHFLKKIYFCSHREVPFQRNRSQKIKSIIDHGSESPIHSGN